MAKGLKGLKIFGGSSHPELTQKICERLGVPPIPVDCGTYPNENQWVHIKATVREHPVFIVQTSCPPVDFHIIQTALLIDAAARASADKITLVAPYFPYVRSDKKDQPRISIAAQLMCDIFTKAAGAYRLLSVELHNAPVQGFAKVFDNLHAGRFFCEALKEQGVLKTDGNFVVVAPDKGGAPLNGNLAQKMGLPFGGMFDKKRLDSYNVKLNLVADPGDIRGKNVIMFDDEILTATTIAEDANYLLEKAGVRSVYACAFHGVFAQGAIERIENSALSSVIVTNTIPQKGSNKKVRVVDISELLTEAIKRIYQGKPLSVLF